jgi:hypothetical protein
MASRQVKCINRTYRAGRHEQIKSIGGDWGITSEGAAINDIKNGIHTYYVKIGYNQVKIIIATHLGHEYLKTEADNTFIDNLLDLPECF